MTPTSRTLTALRRAGWIADVVEHWIPHANRRRDLFGCIDIVAVRGGHVGVLGIQATSLPNVSARIKKAVALPALEIWLAAGNRFEVWGWAKRADGWHVQRVEINAADMRPVVLARVPRKRRRDRWQPAPLFAE